jgi:hypothetical protein
MFGKSYSDYVRFQTPFLIAIAAVGGVRLLASMAGIADDSVKFASMTVVYFAGVIYYGLRVGRTGFGTYRHILPLVLNQSVVFHTISIIGIALSANGFPNVFDKPEFRGPGGSAETTALAHALSHLIVGMTFGTLVGWGLGSAIMAAFVRPARQTAPQA